MSPASDNPNQSCACDAARPEPNIFQAAKERAAAGRLRPRKVVLLPEIIHLSLEGHSSREIGRRLGVPRRTVDRWLRQERQHWAESASENGAELFAVAMARLETVYREAMVAWRRSLADKQVTVKAPRNDGAVDPGGSVRISTQFGQAALLGKAIQAAREISKFHTQHLSAASAAQESEHLRIRRELAEELRGVPEETFQEIQELIRQEGAGSGHSANELAEMLSSLTTAEYRKLGENLRMETSRKLPVRGRRKAK